MTLTKKGENKYRVKTTFLLFSARISLKNLVSMRRNDWSTKNARINPESGTSQALVTRLIIGPQIVRIQVVSETNAINEMNQHWRRTNFPSQHQYIYKQTGRMTTKKIVNLQSLGAPQISFVSWTKVELCSKNVGKKIQLKSLTIGCRWSQEIVNQNTILYQVDGLLGLHEVWS